MPKTAKLNSKDDDDDKSKVVKDGESIRTSMLLMDSVQREVVTHTVTQDALAIHKRGYVQLSDSERVRRQSLYDAYDRRISDAWKGDAA